MADCSILIWAASRSGMFLALETGKGTPRALKKERERANQSEWIIEREREWERRERERKRRGKRKELCIDGERTNEPTGRGGLRNIYTKVYDHAPEWSELVPDTILHLGLVRVSSLWKPFSPIHMSFQQCLKLIYRKNRADILKL